MIQNWSKRAQDHRDPLPGKGAMARVLPTEGCSRLLHLQPRGNCTCKSGPIADMKVQTASKSAKSWPSRPPPHPRPRLLQHLRLPGRHFTRQETTRQVVSSMRPARAHQSERPRLRSSPRTSLRPRPPPPASGHHFKVVSFATQETSCQDVSWPIPSNFQVQRRNNMCKIIEAKLCASSSTAGRF